MENWWNDGTFKCKTCGETFKAYTIEDVRDVNFCPYCASRKIEFLEEESI